MDLPTLLMNHLLTRNEKKKKKKKIEQIKRFKETGDSRYIYQDELDKAYF